MEVLYGFGNKVNYLTYRYPPVSIDLPSVQIFANKKLQYIYSAKSYERQTLLKPLSKLSLLPLIDYYEFEPRSETLRYSCEKGPQ